MDAFTDPAVERVVVQSSAQVGKTEILLNVVGYFIDQDPSPVLVLQPTLEMAFTFSRDRLAPMLRDTPALAAKVRDPRSRDSGNALLHKEFPGARLTLAGGNSPASLAQRPKRIVLCDDVDRFPESAGSEGDSIELAFNRTKTFWNRKFGLFSTPTIKGLSRIEAALKESDQRSFEVPCFACGHCQVLRWAQVRWTQGTPATALYVCESCERAWEDPERWSAVMKGKWRARAPFDGIAGFGDLSEIYSSWVRLGEMAKNFIRVKPYPERLHAWINTSLGETWEEGTQTLKPEDLFGRRERYGSEGIELPGPVVLLTAAVDPQDDRFEIEVEGWSVDEENWGIEHRVVMGDPSSPTIWGQLADVLAKHYRHESGLEMPITAVAIDSGGHHTQSVYTFCRAQARRRVWACKGIGGQGRALVGRPSKNNALRVNLFPIGVDTAKQVVVGRLGIPEPGPGYRHFSLQYDEEFFRQLAAEHLVRRMHKGRERLEWVKVRARNEALDLLVLNLAAMTILNPDLPRVAVRHERMIRAREKQAAGPPAAGPGPIPDPADVARAASRRRDRELGRRGSSRRRGFVKDWTRW